MLDIKEISQDFQKLNKTDNCIVIVLKNDSKLAITSPVSPHLIILNYSAKYYMSLSKFPIVFPVIELCPLGWYSKN